MKSAILFSGGKDSTLAIYHALKESKVECLISIISENKESYMFHTPNIHLVEKQAEAIGIPLMLSKTKGKKEEELIDLKQAIKQAIDKYNLEALYTGALASEYQASRIGIICKELNIKCINPLWHKDPEEYWKEILKLGFEVTIISVSANGLDQFWLGKQIDNKLLDHLIQTSKKFSFHLGFEGGEAETFVTNGPIFKKKLVIKQAEISWKGNSGQYVIKDLELINK